MQPDGCIARQNFWDDEGVKRTTARRSHDPEYGETPFKCSVLLLSLSRSESNGILMTRNTIMLSLPKFLDAGSQRLGQLTLYGYLMDGDWFGDIKACLTKII